MLSLQVQKIGFYSYYTQQIVTWYLCMHTCTNSLLLTTDTKVWMNGAQYLFQLKRGIEAIQGDGNCLFRALSRILCDNENHHNFIRRTLVTFATNNKTWLQKFCHPVPIDGHLNGMKLDRIWGTDFKYMLLVLFGKHQSMFVPEIPTIQNTFGCFLSQLVTLSWCAQRSVCNCHIPQESFTLNCSMLGGVTMM